MCTLSVRSDVCVEEVMVISGPVSMCTCVDLLYVCGGGDDYQWSCIVYVCVYTCYI